MKVIIALFAAAALLVGCSSMHNKVIVATGTNIGVEISENPATGLYQAKLGYTRGELALVPVTNNYTPDVITEIRYSGIFSSVGGIYSRMAVGPVAVSQPGAQLMFAKDPNGTIGTNALGIINRVTTAAAAVKAVP